MNLIKKFATVIRNGLGYGVKKTRVKAGSSFPADPFEAQYLLIDGLKKPAITIFDVGANKGQTTRKYRLGFPAANIYSFEPFPDSISELRRQFSRDKNIHVIPNAVGRGNGTATFYVNEFDATNSLLPRPSSTRRYYPKKAGPKETIKVEIIDLDGFAREKGIVTIDILKLDIQGGELDALQGTQSLLKAERVSLIYTEIMFVPHYENAPLFHEIWSFLSGFGYSLFDIYDLHRANNGQIRFGDALFVSRFTREQIVNNFPEEP